MILIDSAAFAKRIEEYLHNQESFNQEAIVDTLNLVNPISKFKERMGITFGYNTELVMKLLGRSYSSVSRETSAHHFSERVAQAVQHFADPFPKQDNLCYPHFLFHGLIQPNLDDVVGKIESNSRIIHETLQEKDKMMALHGRVTIDGGFQLTMDNGLTDDYFGIAYLLARDNVKLLNSACGYIAKASFFLDRTNNDIYILTIQGRRYESLGSETLKDEAERKSHGEKEFARIGNILRMSPRRFILMKLKDFGRENRFKHINVIKPEEHPMFIENHEGFWGNYEPVVRKAGITMEVDCYLKTKL